MPLYDFRCERGHVTESREGISTEAIPCSCGRSAQRVGVYRGQFIHCETGPKGGLKSPTPRDEIRLGQDVSEFEEAMGEVSHAYEKVEQNPPNLFKKGLAQARKKRVKV